MSFVVTTLTPAVAAKRLQDDGIAALGLAVPRLSPRWTDTDPTTSTGTTYDAATMSLTLGTDTQLIAPFGGTLQFLTASDAVEFTGADGRRPTTRVGALRLHPQAARRLARLAETRYGAPGVRPVPVTMLVHDANQDALGPTGSHTYDAGEPVQQMPSPATVTFHDERGLIVDPIAAAAMLADLLAAFPALAPSGSATAADPGGLTQFAALATGVRVLVTDLHGNLFAAAIPGEPDPAVDPVPVITDAAGAFLRAVPESGAVDLAPAERIAASAGDATAQRLRWGLGTTGTLTRDPLAAPAVPATASPAGTPAPKLGRQFLRVCVVDLDWHLLGNRGAATVRGIPAPDVVVDPLFRPKVRDRVKLEYLTDGMDTLAAAGQVLGRLVPAQPDAQAFLCSADLEPMLSLPPAPGPSGHWPAFPAPLPGPPAGFGVPVPTPAQGISAVWDGSTGTDVLVTVQAAQVPVDAHVRIYPRRFVEIPAIGPEPSLVRGDGVATVATSAAALVVRLPDPLGLGGKRPGTAPTLLLDIVVAPRVGRRRLFAGIAVSVAAGSAVPGPDPFAATADPLAAVDLFHRSTCRSPLLGLARVIPPPTVQPATTVDLVRHFLSEQPPREGPRLPTMARFETVVAAGIPAPGIGADDPLTWDAVLTGGRWARETRSAGHADGNPGNPAGVDVHAPGIRVGGALAYDLALHAMRRAQPMAPVPPSANPGWLTTIGRGHMAPPATPASDTPTAGQPALTGVGVALSTVAAVCETPELSTVPDSDFAPTTFDELLTKLRDILGLKDKPPIDPPSSTPNANRMIVSARQEFFTSKHGARETLWSLRRAIAQARNLVYVQGPQLAHTADAASLAGGAVDLVGELVGRLQAEKGLRLLVALPRVPDVAASFGGWTRQALKARAAAVADLRAAAPGRVLVFHPVGFPGRATAIRSTTVIVDDVWCLTGAAHWRRRGLTFDGSAAVASFDRRLVDGVSAGVRDHRRALLAALLRVPVPGPTDAPSADWVMLGRPAGAFIALRRLLEQGGLGRVEPFWPGPTDLTGAQSDAVADPDGRDGASLFGVLAGSIGEAGGP